MQLLYASPEILNAHSRQLLLNEMPAEIRQRMASLRRDEDRQLLLTSMLLLRKMLSINGLRGHDLSEMRRDNSGRPYFPGASFDFNISHTSGCAAILFSENSRLGLDIEKIVETDISDFSAFLTERQWDEIGRAENKLKAFFDQWTLLESALKADGRGLPILDREKISIKEDEIVLGEKRWFYRHIHFDPSISCCITADREISLTEPINITSI